MRKQAWFSVGMRCFTVICVVFVRYSIQLVVFVLKTRIARPGGHAVRCENVSRYTLHDRLVIVENRLDIAAKEGIKDVLVSTWRRALLIHLSVENRICFCACKQRCGGVV